ncbi:MAG: hypothetical protein Q8R60_00765 [Mycobacteriales bacterium]|nr:hypothetical protein [Mycobacteriales bacterium]
MVALLLRTLLVGAFSLTAVAGTAVELWAPVPLAVADPLDVATPTGGPVLVVPPAPRPPAVTRTLPRTEPVRRTPVARPVQRESRQAYADRRGRAALAALGYPTERLGYAIVFRPYVGRELGRADGRTRTITLYVKPGQSERVLRVTLAHEIGHVVDYLTSTDESRAAYLRARGIAPQRWFPCSGCSDYASPAGDFAEVFALWLAGPGDFRSRMAPAPGRAQLAQLGARFFQPPA